MLARGSSVPTEAAAAPICSDWRGAERHDCDLEVFYRPLGTTSPWLWWLARARDISQKGIGLTLKRGVEPGALLSLELQNVAETYERTALVRVIHVRAAEDGRSWQVGAAFITRLQEEELQTLLS